MGKVSVWEDEKFLKNDGADSGTTTNVFSATELYI